MKKILVAIDGSRAALKAVEYAGEYYSRLDDVEITLFHVLPFVPAVFWDDGHILTGEERAERKKVVDKWLSNQTSMIEPIFTEAAEILMERGMDEERITLRSVSDAPDVADGILEEARNGRYGTLVMGRCGSSQAKHLLMGSVASKVINHGAGIAICVVE